MKPLDVTDEDLARWEEEYVESETKNPAGPQYLVSLFPGFKTPSHHDVFIAGCWLDRELQKLGLDAQTIGEIGFANGQKAVYCLQYHNQNAWDRAKQTLEEYKAGKLDGLHGPDLARDLQEKYGMRMMRDFKPDLAYAKSLMNDERIKKFMP